MKKIVGILAVAALFATSVFASDISAATKIRGDLFFNGESTWNDNGVEKVGFKGMRMFSERNDSHDYANPNFTMSISDDQAGATVKITTDNYGGGTYSAPKVTTQTIWFKPIDALKITVGDYDIALNKEQIDWTESKTGLGGKGYLLSVGASGLAIDFGIEANERYWISKADGTDAALTPFFVKVAYAADFGNIGAFAKFTDFTDKAKKDILFGAGYRNNFSGVDAFLNVVGDMGEKFNWIRPELYAAGSADAFGYALFVAPLIYTNSDLNKDAECELTVKLTYAMDGITPYVYFNDKNLMADKFTATVKLGATGSVGAMGWNAWVQIDTAQGLAKDTTNISIPVEFTIGL